MQNPATTNSQNPQHPGSPAVTVVPTNPPGKLELQLLINSIPEYSPGQNLSIFITEVDKLTNHLTGRLTPELEYILDCNIRSKIKGEARDFLSYQDADNWTEIRKSLLQRFGDQRSEEILANTLKQCVQARTETVLDYYARLLKNFNNLMQNITLNITEPNYLAFKKYEYTKLSSKIFQNGLLDPYRSYLSHFELESLEECISKCHALDNRQTEWDYSEFLRKSQVNPKTPSRSFNPPNRQFNQNLMYRNPPPIPALNSASYPRAIQYNPVNQNYQNISRPPQHNHTTYNQPNTVRSPQLPPKPSFVPRFPMRPPSGTYKNIRTQAPMPTPMSIQSRVHTTQFNQNRPWSNPQNNIPKRPNIHNLETDDFYEDTCEDEPYYNTNNEEWTEPDDIVQDIQETDQSCDDVNFQVQASQIPTT